MNGQSGIEQFNKQEKITPEISITDSVERLAQEAENRTAELKAGIEEVANIYKKLEAEKN